MGFSLDKATELLKFGFSKQQVKKITGYLPDAVTGSALDCARKVAKEFPSLIENRDWNGIAWQLYSKYKLSPFKAYHATKNLMTFHYKKGGKLENNKKNVKRTAE
jgi:hypothetical protein